MAQRRASSVQREPLNKSKEAALNAVQTFNNPLTTFKTETFIVLMVVAWTYMLHAYYGREHVEYRYFKQNKVRRRFDRTKSGAFRYWDLARWFCHISGRTWLKCLISACAAWSCQMGRSRSALERGCATPWCPEI